MKTARRIALGLVFLIASGCAQRADWIQGTLVTVDVVGRWTGNFHAVGYTGIGNLDMTLRQTGPRATGDLRLTVPNAQLWNGPIEGTVNGDLFKFRRKDGRLSGEVIVAGDEMSGTITFAGGTRTLRLQRQP
jgi:hypothetical protein